MTPITVRLRAEAAGGARSTAATTVVAALQRLAASLDIPVTLAVDVVDGGGRLRIGTTSFALDPSPNGGDAPGLDHLAWFAPHLVTPEVAAAVWRSWSPARADDVREPGFLSQLTRVLGEAVELGFRLERFRESFTALTVQAGAEDWTRAFEQAIASVSPSLRIHVSPQHHAALVAADWNDQTWDSIATFMVDGMFVELGVHFPLPTVHVDERLSAAEFRCEWNDLELPPRPGLEIEEILVNDTPERLRLMNVEGRSHENPATLQPAAVVGRESQAMLEAAGLTTWDARGYFVLVMAAQMRRHAAAFISSGWVEFIVAQMEGWFPRLGRMVTRHLSLSVLVRVLRALVTEGVSIRNMPALLTGLLLAESRLVVAPRLKLALPLPGTGTLLSAYGRSGDGLSTEDYIDVARRALSREIANKLSRSTNTLVVYLFDGAIERRLAASSRLSPSDRESLLRAIDAEMAHLPPTALIPILLVSGDVSRRLRTALLPERWMLQIAAYEDLPPTVNIQPVARISATFGEDGAAPS